VFAVAVPEKAETLAGTVARTIHANVVEIGQAQAMHGKAAAADVARDFLEDVVKRPARVGDGKKARRRLRQARAAAE